MNFNVEDRLQSKHKKIWSYLKNTFYYDYYTYDISKCSELVKQLLAIYFKKLGDNKIVKNIYGELPDDNSVYLEYMNRNNILFDETKDILSPTCLKGEIFTAEYNHTIIKIGIRAHSNYLIFFIITFIAGLIFAYNTYNKSRNDLMFLLPLIISVTIMFLITRVANSMKASLRKEFENIISSMLIEE